MSAPRPAEETHAKLVVVRRMNETQMLEVQRRVRAWLDTQAEAERVRLEAQSEHVRRVAQLVNEVAARSALSAETLRSELRAVVALSQTLVERDTRVIERALKLEAVKLTANVQDEEEAQRIAERERRRRCPSCSNTKSVFLPACRKCLRSMSPGRKRGRK